MTPQANTTVEPEYAILTPPGFAFINARMLSPKKTIEERLVDYFDNVHAFSRQFANAPVGALAFACEHQGRGGTNRKKNPAESAFGWHRRTFPRCEV